MTDFSNTNWSSLSDNAILAQLGNFIKTERLRQNRSQSDVSESAGISRSTLSLLERGESVNLATLIQVLRVLDRLNALDGFQVEEIVRPLELAKQKRSERQRASRSSKDETDW